MKPTFLKNKKGQAMVEAALAFPILLAFTFMITDVGYGYYVQNSLNNIARDTARRVATDPRLNPNYDNGKSTAADKLKAVSDAVDFANLKITNSPGVAGPKLNIDVNVPGVNSGGNVMENPVEVNISRELSLFTSKLVGGANTVNLNAISGSFVEASAISTVDPDLLKVEDPDLNHDGIPNDKEDPKIFKKQLDDFTCKTDKKNCKDADHQCSVRGECTCASGNFGKCKTDLDRCRYFGVNCTPEIKCQLNWNQCPDISTFCTYYPAACATDKDYWDCKLFSNSCTPVIRCRLNYTQCPDISTFCTHYTASCLTAAQKDYYDCKLFNNSCTPAIRCQINSNQCPDISTYCTYYAANCSTQLKKDYYDCTLFKNNCTSDVQCFMDVAKCTDSTQLCSVQPTYCNDKYLCQRFSEKCTPDILCQINKTNCDVDQLCKFHDQCTDVQQRCKIRGVCIGVGS